MRDLVMFLCIFLFFLLHLPHVYWSCDHLTYIVLIFGLYIFVDVCYFTYLFMCYFVSFFLYMFFIYCMQSIIYVSR